MRLLASLLLVCSLVLSGAITFASSDGIVGAAGLVNVALERGQAAAGLKEALLTSTADAVHLTGRRDGYFDNRAIKILLPQQLKPLETGLRAVGYGPNLDQFVLSMNRAAEAAAPKAEPIFKQAIMNMSFADAQGIVSGGGHSATDYFKRKTSDELRTAFAPIVRVRPWQLVSHPMAQSHIRFSSWGDRRHAAICMVATSQLSPCPQRQLGQILRPIHHAGGR